MDSDEESEEGEDDVPLDRLFNNPPANGEQRSKVPTPAAQGAPASMWVDERDSGPLQVSGLKQMSLEELKALARDLDISTRLGKDKLITQIVGWYNRSSKFLKEVKQNAAGD